MQERLLAYYLREDDWVQVHRTLAVLTIASTDPHARAWNLMLEARIRQVDFEGVTKVLNEMRSLELPVGQKAVRELVRHFLRQRQQGHTPVSQPLAQGVDDLRFVTTRLVSVLESGLGYVTPLSWREITRRYGMTGRFRELRRLVRWLVCWYALRSESTPSGPPKPAFLDTATARLRYKHSNPTYYFNLSPSLSRTAAKHPFNELFPSAWQQGVVRWGFRAGLLPQRAARASTVFTRSGQSSLSDAVSPSRARVTAPLHGRPRAPRRAACVWRDGANMRRAQSALYELRHAVRTRLVEQEDQPHNAAKKPCPV